MVRKIIYRISCNYFITHVRNCVMGALSMIYKSSYRETIEEILLSESLDIWCEVQSKLTGAIDYAIWYVVSPSGTC